MFVCRRSPLSLVCGLPAPSQVPVRDCAPPPNPATRPNPPSRNQTQPPDYATVPHPPFPGPRSLACSRQATARPHSPQSSGSKPRIWSSGDCSATHEQASRRGGGASVQLHWREGPGKPPSLSHQTPESPSACLHHALCLHHADGQRRLANPPDLVQSAAQDDELARAPSVSPRRQGILNLGAHGPTGPGFLPSDAAIHQAGFIPWLPSQHQTPGHHLNESGSCSSLAW